MAPELMHEFNSRPGNQDISFTLGQSNTNQLLENLLADKYDVVLSSYQESINDQETDTLFKFVPIVRQEIMAALPVNHPLNQKAHLQLSDLAPYNFVMFSKASGLRPHGTLFKDANFKPKVKYEIEEDHTIIGLVQYGMGLL